MFYNSRAYTYTDADIAGLTTMQQIDRLEELLLQKVDGKPFERETEISAIMQELKSIELSDMEEEHLLGLFDDDRIEEEAHQLLFGFFEWENDDDNRNVRKGGR